MIELVVDLKEEITTDKRLYILGYRLFSEKTNYDKEIVERIETWGDGKRLVTISSDGMIQFSEHPISVVDILTFIDRVKTLQEGLNHEFSKESIL